MPVQVQPSILSKKYGTKLTTAVKKHAGDEIDWGFQRIPGGINNGVAQTTECMFALVAQGKKNAGEAYFRAVGVVVEPYSIIVDGMEVVVKGMQTSIMEMVCDTTDTAGKVTSQEEHVTSIMNELRKLGYTFPPNPTADDLEKAAILIKTTQPYFRFSTSVSRPQIDPATNKPKVDPTTGKPYDSRVWENWHGVKNMDSYQPPGNSGTVDNTGTEHKGDEALPEPSSNSEVVDNEGNPAFNEGQSEETTANELTLLAESADGGDKSAGIELNNRASAAGLDVKKGGQIDLAKSWEEVADMIRQATEGSGEESQPEEVTEEWKPVKGQLYDHKPTTFDKTSKKLIVAKKGISCEVVSINEKLGTVDLKNMVDGKTIYKGVGWGNIKPE